MAELGAWQGSIRSYQSVNYTEGLFIDYRHFDKADIEPIYPFGYGACAYIFASTGTDMYPSR